MINKEEIFNDGEKFKGLIRIIAHLMGDGCVSKKYFAYYNKNDTLLENFEKDVQFVFGDIHFIKGTMKHGVSYVMVQNKPIFDFLKSIVEDYRSFTLKVPEFVNTKELQKEFLSALYDDEGSAPLRIFKETNEIKRNVSLSSNSLIMIEQIKNILLKTFGINPNKISKNTRLRNSKIFTNYVLNITGKENLEKFREQIGFKHPEKSAKLNLMLNSYIRLKTQNRKA